MVLIGLVVFGGLVRPASWLDHAALHDVASCMVEAVSGGWTS